MSRAERSAVETLSDVTTDLVQIVGGFIEGERTVERRVLISPVQLRSRALQLAIQARGAVPTEELFATAEEFADWLLDGPEPWVVSDGQAGAE